MSQTAALQDDIFCKWLSDNGAIFPKIKFQRSVGGMEAKDGKIFWSATCPYMLCDDRCLVLADIAPKEIFLQIPAKLMMTSNTICQSSELVANAVNKSVCKFKFRFCIPFIPGIGVPKYLLAIKIMSSFCF